MTKPTKAQAKAATAKARAAKKPNVSKLNERQRRFAREYLVDRNGTQAAIRAGYTASVADVTAVSLLGDHRIAKLVADGEAKLAAKVEVKAEEVVRELKRIAFSDMRDVSRWNDRGVRLRDSDELSDDEAASVAEVSEGQFGVKVKRHDKVRALELLGRICGVIVDKHELTGKDGAPLAPAVVYLPDNARGDGKGA